MKHKQPKQQERMAAVPKGGFRHGDHAEIPEEALSFRERKVLATLRGGVRAQSVRELARTCFPGMRAKAGTYESTLADGTRERHASGAAYRCVLNSLRRLVAGGFVSKEARGSYVATLPALSTIAQTVGEPHLQPDTEETNHE